MKKKQKLFTLIKTMNRGEKRAFKLFAQKYNKDNSFYIRLFDALDKMDNFDIDIIKKKVIKTNKDLKQFPVIKNQLFNIILSCLRNHKENKPGSLQYNLQLESYEILMDRGMFKEALSYLLKAENKARNIENFPQLISILDKKKNVYQRLLSINLLAEKLKAISQEKKRIIKILDLEDWFANQYHTIYHVYRTNGTELQDELKVKFNQFQSELEEKETEAPSVKAMHYFYLSQTTISYTLNNMERAIKYVEKHIQLLKSHPFFLQLNLNEYLKSVNNAIIIKIGQGKFSSALEEVNQFEAEFIHKDGEINKFLEQRVFEISYSAKLSICVENLQLDEGLSLIPNIEKGITAYKNVGMSIDRNMRLSFGISLLHFWKEDWAKSLEWLDKIEAIEIETKSSPSQVVSYAKLLKIICHFELGNYELLESIIRSTQRYMKKNKRLFPTEAILLKYLKKLGHSPNQSKSLFKELKTKFIASQLGKNYNIIQSSLRINAWIDSKIEDRSIESLLA